MTNSQSTRLFGRVISLDRGFPLVKLERTNKFGVTINDTTINLANDATDTSGTSGTARAVNTAEIRCQHSVELIKNCDMRSACGDVVEIEAHAGHDILQIVNICKRGHTLYRRSMVESRHVGVGKHAEQILATNIDVVFVVVALSSKCLDPNYLERQLVCAHESGAKVVVVLTKADLARHLDEDVACAQKCALSCETIVSSNHADFAAVAQNYNMGKVTAAARIKELLGGNDKALGVSGCDGFDGGQRDRFGVLLGRSGVGKSSLINMLLGQDAQATGDVRKKDRGGRHVTVSRRMLFMPDGGAVIDTPGLRSVGLYDAELGLAKTFADVVAFATGCHYRDCTHSAEPNCALQQAVTDGKISKRRLESYINIATEVFDR